MSTLAPGTRPARRRSRDAVHPGHLDVEQRDVGPELGARPPAPRRREPTSATTSRSGSRPSRAASAPRTRAWSSASSSRMGAGAHPTATRSVCPRGSSTRVVTVPPTAAARSRSPTRPLPARGLGRRPRARPPVPSSTTSAASGPSRTVHRVAPLCRTTLVTPSRTVQANSSRRCGRHVVRGVGQLGLDVGGGQRRSRAGELAGQGQLAVARDGPAHVGQRVAREALEVGDLGPGPLDVDVEQPVGQLGLDRDDRQRVAEDVVQVAGEAGPLVLDGQLGVLLVGTHQVDVARHHLADAEHRQRRREDREEQPPPGSTTRGSAARAAATSPAIASTSTAASRTGSTITAATAK